MTRAPIGDLHLSHGLTYVALGCGLAAVAAGQTVEGRHIAGGCLAMAALADTFDGRFARLFTRSRRQSAVGGQIDSLVDASVFGIVPVVILARFAGPDPGALAACWWLAALVYGIATVTRLAFFNLQPETAGFVGLPTPAVALAWSSVLFVTVPSSVAAAMFVCLAAAMTVPLVIPRPRGLALALFAAWAVGLAGLHMMQALS
jgi:CDP-diacylglycerol--serine O-phosphatidyltransferase